MQITITQQQYNPLLKRHEISFLVDHSQTRGTPTRLEVRKALAETLKTNPDVVYIRRLETKAGTMTAKGEAEAYDSIEQGKLVVPKYVITRNGPKEKKEAPEKAEKPQQPTKTAEKAEKPPKPWEKTEKPAQKEG